MALQYQKLFKEEAKLQEGKSSSRLREIKENQLELHRLSHVSNEQSQKLLRAK